MEAVKKLADTLIRQTSEIMSYIQSIYDQTVHNLDAIKDKVTSLMVDVEIKTVNILPRQSTSNKKKFKEHVQHHSYYLLKDLHKQANTIQDALCSLQGVNSDSINITIPEIEFNNSTEIEVETRKIVLEQAVETIICEARVLEVINDEKLPLSGYNCCLQADLENQILMLSSDTSDIDCYKFKFDQNKERLQLAFVQSFKDTPFFFLTHGDNRLIVDGVVFQMSQDDSSGSIHCIQIMNLGSDLVGGCVLDSTHILLSHSDSQHFSVWMWQGSYYVKVTSRRFSGDQDKIASMLRLNPFNISQNEVFFVSEESKLNKFLVNQAQLERSQIKKFQGRLRQVLLDYRIIRADRIIQLYDDNILIISDSYMGIELHSCSIAAMAHKNILSYSGPQINLDTHPYIIEDTAEGRLWLVNMKASKDKVQKKIQVKYLSDFQPISQIQIGQILPFQKTEDLITTDKLYILGLDVHEQVLCLAEISTQIKNTYTI